MLRAWLADLDRHGAEHRIAWLHRVARNLAVDAHRRNRAVPVGAVVDDMLHRDMLHRPDATGDPADRVVDRQVVRGALARLSPEHREVLLHVHLHDRTRAEAARMIAADAADAAKAPADRGASAAGAEQEKEPEQTAQSEKKEEQPEYWTTRVVSAPSTLTRGQFWSTNRISMVMQEDGNLVVYDENGKATWASMTFGEHHSARFQEEGNLVVYNGADRPVWASQTHGHPGAKLVLRRNGEVVVADRGTVLWST